MMQASKDREARLAVALRANLRRRKGQSRDRVADPAPLPEVSGHPSAGSEPPTISD